MMFAIEGKSEGELFTLCMTEDGTLYLVEDSNLDESKDFPCAFDSQGEAAGVILQYGQRLCAEVERPSLKLEVVDIGPIMGFA